MKHRDSYKGLSKRKINLLYQPNYLLLTVLLLFSIIVGRLSWLQLFNGSRYRKLSDENRVRLISSAPIRGRMLDLSGNVLADNKLVYSLIAQPHLISEDDWLNIASRLSTQFNFDYNHLNKLYQKGLQENQYSINLINNLSTEQVLQFREQESLFKGLQVNSELVRFYPFKTLASHVLGYTQLITMDEYRKLSQFGYKLKDRIGRIGLEAAYEDRLRGKWGGEMLEIDALGRIQRNLGYKAPQSGEDIVLTLDLQLQEAAEKALQDKSAGAIVVLDPRTGAVRALASKPNFDPNFFTKNITTQKEYEEIFLSSDLPLLSRALNAYDPGSTWKVVTGVAGMESGKFPPDIRLGTARCIRYGSHCFPEHNPQGWGWIGYEDAFRVSSNTFFYQVGVGSGIKELYDSAIKLGFYTKTGIELANEESRGFVANKAWADKGRGWGKPGTTPWIPEDIASASIGQMVIQVTPLQLARAYAVFANGGYLITPHLVEGDTDWLSAKYRRKVDIKPETLNTIRQGLRKVAISGTGRSINLDLPTLPPVAGKTGTAEDSSGGSDHAWFACFAPYESSEIVIVAFAQNTPGGGSVHALPMAREILKVWNKGL